jgi:hypothetical protein
MATDGLSVSAQVDGNVTANNMQTDSVEEGGIGSGVFPNHPRSGFYFSEKGKAMEAWEMTPLESTSSGDSRHQTPDNITQTWDSTTIVDTGETRGIGTEAGPTDLPNHTSEG